MRRRPAQAVQPRRRDLQRVRLLSHRLPQQARLLGFRVELVLRLHLLGIGFVLVLVRVGIGIVVVRLVVVGSCLDGDLLVSEKKDSVFFGFKEFVLRGNVLDLAVAVVVGAAFTSIVNALVTGVFNPAIGALFNAGSLTDALDWEIPAFGGGTAVLKFGVAVAAIVQFMIVAVVVYFVLVMPLNRLKRIAFAKQAQEPTEEDRSPLPPSEAELLLQIRDLLAAQADKEAVPTTTGTHSVIVPSNGQRPAS